MGVGQGDEAQLLGHHRPAVALPIGQGQPDEGNIAPAVDQTRSRVLPTHLAQQGGGLRMDRTETGSDSREQVTSGRTGAHPRGARPGRDAAPGRHRHRRGQGRRPGQQRRPHTRRRHREDHRRGAAILVRPARLRPDGLDPRRAAAHAGGPLGRDRPDQQCGRTDVLRRLRPLTAERSSPWRACPRPSPTRYGSTASRC